MAKVAKKEEQSIEIQVLTIEQGVLEFYVLGTSPFIFHEFSDRARWELLIPRGRKSAMEKASTLKHDPLMEYRASAAVAREGDTGPTKLIAPATMFKAAISDVAIDMPGVNKSMIGRMVYVEGTWINMYGVPQLLMSTVRSADMAKTPDIRSRAILPEWCCKLRLRYAKPFLNDAVMMNLVAAAGMMRGVGDWRTQKGKGDYGQFKVVGKNDPDVKRIMEKGGKAAQEAALFDPIPFDERTAIDYAYFNEEVKRRGWERGPGDVLRHARRAEAVQS